MQIKIVAKGTVPKTQTKGAVCVDLSSYYEDTPKDKFTFHNCILQEGEDGVKGVIINPGGRCAIPTGLRIAVPEGYEAVVRPRSGYALMHGLTVLNTPGTVDSDYRGEIKVILYNAGPSPIIIGEGERIAQLGIRKTEKPEWVVVEELDETERGEGGFNSTGNK